MMSMRPAPILRAVPLALALLALTATGAADDLRNVQPGQPLPPFDAPGLDEQLVKSADSSGKVLVLVYLSARQKQSEEVLTAAHRAIGNLASTDVQLVYMSSDVDQADYFRGLRDRATAHEPFALDEGRAHYGRLGLIVFPTTVISAKNGTLLHVLAGWTRDYDYQLEAYCRHALGQFNDAELTQRLAAKPQDKDDARSRAERHRAVSAILRGKGMPDAALQELEQAIQVDPQCADAVTDVADILVSQGKLDEAEKRLQDLLAKQPQAHGAKLVLGIISLKRDKLPEAEKYLNDALTLNPDPVRVRYYLGQLYERRGDFKAAMEQYREALKRSLKEP